MIIVRLFASLKELVGEASLTLPSEQVPTPRHVFDHLARKQPSLERLRPVTRVAVNQNYSDWDVLLSAGDEVAFFPPVSGGRR